MLVVVISVGILLCGILFSNWMWFCVFWVLISVCNCVVFGFCFVINSDMFGNLVIVLIIMLWFLCGMSVLIDIISDLVMFSVVLVVFWLIGWKWFWFMLVLCRWMWLVGRLSVIMLVIIVVLIVSMLLVFCLVVWICVVVEDVWF